MPHLISVPSKFISSAKKTVNERTAPATTTTHHATYHYRWLRSATRREHAQDAPGLTSAASVFISGRTRQRARMNTREELPLAGMLCSGLVALLHLLPLTLGIC